jgi:hypothetical protein
MMRIYWSGQGVLNAKSLLEAFIRTFVARISPDALHRFDNC